MRKLLSSLLALMLIFASCVGFAFAWWEDSGRAEVRLRACPSVGYDWEYTFDKENMLREVSCEFVPYDIWQPILGAPYGNKEWHFEALQEGDVTITFTSSGYWDNVRSQYVESRTALYTYHIDSDLNIEFVCASMVNDHNPYVLDEWILKNFLDVCKNC